MKSLFVDCFNTIVKRNVSSETLIRFWAFEMSRFLETTGITASQLISLREAAVKMNKVDFEQNFGIKEYSASETYELLLKNIETFDLIKLTEQQKKDFVKKSIDIELENEKQYSYINEKVLKIIKKYRNEGYKVYLLTDYYHSKDYIFELLKSLNVTSYFDDIFVSNECKKSKYSGNFYAYVLEKLSLKAKECTMVGDNVLSDIKNAKKMGFNTIHIFNSEKKRNKTLFKKFDKKIQNELNLIFKQDVKSSAYVNYAFPLYEFIKKLYINCINKKIDKLYFFAREGYFLKKLFDYFQKNNIKKIKTYYLEVSRNSLLVPSLEINLKNESFGKILNRLKHISIHDFLHTLSFNNKEILKIQEGFGVDVDFDEQHEIFEFKEQIIPKLKKLNEFEKEYLFKIKEQNKLLLQYLKQFDITDSTRKIAVVDVGWSGTMQDCLRDVLKKDILIEGYYIGLMNVAKIDLNNLKFGLLFSDAPFARTKQGNVYSVNNFNYEFILQANKNKTNSYKLEKDKVKPCYEESDDIKIFDSYIKDLQNKIFEKFKKIIDCVKEFKILNFEKFALYFNYKMIMRQKVKDYKFMLLLRKLHYEGFGNYGKIYEGLKFNLYQFLAFIYKKYKMQKFYKKLTDASC